MKATFKDLKPESIEKLKPDIMYWCTLNSFDLSLPINHKFDINTSGFNRFIAEYAVMYAILYDDKDLTRDLCGHQANLDIKDEFCQNMTPVELAIAYGRAGILNILIQANAKIPEDAQVPSNNPCTAPKTFLWSLREWTQQREVDYSKVKLLLASTQKMK